MNPIIFKNLTHKYTDSPVLNNLTFEIEENTITAIIGRSGAGKSSLLQIINGLIVPVSGEVIIFGKQLDYNRIYEIRLNIGYAVQEITLFPHMTIHNNISLLGKITSKPKNVINERIKLLMKLVNLDPDFSSKYPYQLSGGEQQRVGLCRAILLNPKVFLLDEAFGALDPTTRFEIHKEVIKLQKFEPRTIVMVTHDLNEALNLGDKILILEKGVIQQYGTKEQILNSPANDFVKEFIKIREY